MEIKIKKLSEITENDYNPNEIPEDKYKSLVENIKQFGFLQPILNVMNMLSHSRNYRIREAKLNGKSKKKKQV